MSLTVQQEKQHLVDILIEKISNDELINNYLGQTKVMLEGGKWWKRCRQYMLELESDFINDDVDYFTFKEKLDGYYFGLRKGCKRFKELMAKRSKKKAA